MFNEGQRLTSVGSGNGDAEFVAYIIFSDDKSKVELFTPKGHKVLEKTAPSLYKNEGWIYNDAERSVYINGNKKYTMDTMVGGDADEHGCSASTGTTWSKLSQDCIRLFDVAQRLNPIERNKNEAIISAFVLINKDRSKAEIFVTEIKTSVILDKAEEQQYKNSAFSYDDKDGNLYIGGKLKYSKNR